jgi:hypothetical protein
MTFDVDQAVERALTAKGSGRLSFGQLIAVLNAGRARGLPLSAIDATRDGGAAPGQHGFYIHLDEMEDAGETRTVMAEKSADWALAYYGAGEAEAADEEFEVWFRP